MWHNSITLKLLLLIVCAFVITAVSVLLLADYQLTHIIDKSQKAVYAEKVEAIRETLHLKNERLQQTGLVKAYITDFQNESLNILRKTYYNRADQNIYPFIVDASGRVILHPVLPRGDASLEKTKVVRKMLAARSGDFVYTYQGQKKWCLFEQFPEWGWVIGYTIPQAIKYADARQFRDFLILIMGGITILVLLALSMMLTRFTRPIVKLTRTAKAMAGGDLDQQINLGQQGRSGHPGAQLQPHAGLYPADHHGTAKGECRTSENRTGPA